MKLEALAQAKLLLRQSDVGVVSTLSQSMEGYPFGSVTPFISDSKGSVYFYISDIAQHTRNMKADSRMSLTIFNHSANGDQNENARVTLIGDGALVPPDRQDEMLDRYVRRFPESEGYKKAHDYNVWQVDVKRVRYIGGFGKIHWLEKEQWEGADAPWDKQAEDYMVDHMNKDHSDAMISILKVFGGIEAEDVTMSGVVSDGCYLMSQGKNTFIPFSGVCFAQEDVRKQHVALTKSARLR